MANDDPTSRRMDFGYTGARASGVTQFNAPRSARQVNRDLETSEAARKLRDEVEKDPEWRPFVEHWIRQGLNALDTLQALRNADDYAWRKKTRGYSPRRYAPF